jgi:anti-sigma factor RsiW
MTSDCEQLDAYLLDDLADSDAARFKQHLGACAACREAVEQQRWIDDLLQSQVRAELERTPRAIVDSVQKVAARHDRRRRVLTYALATAAALLIAVGWLAHRRSAATPPMQSATQEIAVADAPRVPTNESKPEGTFVATTDAIVVPVDSSSDDVTIVQVYQTTESERQWRLDHTLSNISTKLNGG